MTLRNIAYKNIKGNLNKYVMYYLSNALVVMVFFIFANFVFNPDVKGINTSGDMGGLTVRVLFLCEIIILIFTFVFTIYSISNFLRSREKEFGLLSMFGFTKGQIRQYIMYENVIVSALSIGTGVLLGILFSKLFFMAVTVILLLDTQIPFSISPKAVTITIVCFFLLFQVICYMISLRIKNNNIIELLRGARAAKPLPEFSRKKAAMSILLIASGYALAVVSSQAIIITMFPILFVTVLGTHYLYSQFSVYFTSKLQNNKKVFYKGMNMVTLSQIIYKLKDNARILFVVSILASVALTASAGVYSFQKVLQSDLDSHYTQDISFIENGLNVHKIIMPEKLETILREQGHEAKFKSKIVLLEAEVTDLSGIKPPRFSRAANLKNFYIISNKDYNLLAKEFGKVKLDLNEGEGIIYSCNFVGGKAEKLFSGKEYLSMNVQGQPAEFKIKKETSGAIINMDSNNASTMVVSDQDYNRLLAGTPDDKKSVYYGYNIRDWLKASDTVGSIKTIIPAESANVFTERVIAFTGYMKGMSIFLFIGTFVAILFFIATGSILYFKLFNELQKDRQEFVALKKMGISTDEVKKTVSIQCAVMFFLPFITAFCHTAFAITALSNLLGSSLSIYLLTIVGIYFILQVIYYAFSKSMYTRQINNWGI